MTLVEKVRAVLARDDTGKGPIALSASKIGPAPHTDRDSDISAWGVTFGIAWGIARTENPFESDDEVGKRAMTAAWAVFSEFNDPIAPAPRT